MKAPSLTLACAEIVAALRALDKSRAWEEAPGFVPGSTVSRVDVEIMLDGRISIVVRDGRGFVRDVAQCEHCESDQDDVLPSASEGFTASLGAIMAHPNGRPPIGRAR